MKLLQSQIEINQDVCKNWDSNSIILEGAKITNNFNVFQNVNTKQKWKLEINETGRPTNSNPNNRYSNLYFNNTLFTIIRKGWIIAIYKGDRKQIQNVNDPTIMIKINIKPEYIK